MILFDAIVLTHKLSTVIENYTYNILEQIKDKNIIIVKPNISNKYFFHLWTHFILPFKQGSLLFSPANISPLYLSKSKKVEVIHCGVSNKFKVLKNIKNLRLVIVGNFSLNFPLDNEIRQTIEEAKRNLNTILLPEVRRDSVLYYNPYDIINAKDKNLHNSLVAKALQRVKKFTWEYVAQQHMEVFKKVGFEI